MVKKPSKSKELITNILHNVKIIIDLIFSTSGYVYKHANFIRTSAMILVVLFSVYLALYQETNFKLAITYYAISVTLYIGFITSVLRKNGYRTYFIKKWGAKKGYLVYEGILGFLFFNSGTSIFYVASSTPGNLFQFVNREIVILVSALLLILGITVKLWATKVVSIDIYYWKDMFLGEKISKFVAIGPYKYLSNPMYGVGQLHAYAVAIFYNSIYGLIAAAVYQCLVFTFYFTVEKDFIRRVYLNKSIRKSK